MKKAELEKELIELKAKVAALEARPQQFFCGHTCTCNHYNYPQYPSTPWYTPGTTYGSITVTSSSLSNGTLIN